MTRDLLIISSLGLVSVGAAAAAIWQWSNPRHRRLIPGAVLTVAAIELLVTGYAWWFDQGTCGSRSDVICVTNANQGVLTLVALAVAGMAIWVEVIARLAQRNRDSKAERRRVETALLAAAQEIHHNLLHIAPCYVDGRLAGPPASISCEATNYLAQPPIRDLLHARITGRLDPLQRNFNTIIEIRERCLEGGPIHRWQMRRVLRADPLPFEYYIKQSLAFFLYCGIYYGDICNPVLRRGTLRDLPDMIERFEERGDYEMFHRTSDPEAQRRAGEMRTEQTPVMCWIDDKSLGCEHVFEFCSKFQDAAIGHVH